jgi:hypothetical protein
MDPNTRKMMLLIGLNCLWLQVLSEVSYYDQ